MESRQIKKISSRNTIRKFLNKENTAGVICTLPFTVGFLMFLVIPMAISAIFTDFVILIFFLRRFGRGWKILS